MAQSQLENPSVPTLPPPSMPPEHQRPAWLSRLAWLPIPILLTAMAVLWIADLRNVWPLPTLNWLVHYGSAVLGVVFIVGAAGRSFLANGQPSVLMLGCGVLMSEIGAAAMPAGVARSTGTGFAIYNTSVLLSALCQFIGVAITARRAIRVRRSAQWLTVAFAGATMVMGLVIWLAFTARMPVFFIDEAGGTPLRSVVVSAAVALFLLTAGLLWQTNRRTPSRFLYWYALGLVLVAAGLAGSMVIAVRDSPLQWVTRFTQIVGLVYMCVAVVTSAHDSTATGLALAAVEDAWREHTFPVGLRQQTPVGWGLRYGLAVAAVAAAMGMRLALTAWIGPGLPAYISFYPAVMVVAVLAGFGPGALATAVAGFVAAYYLLPPIGQLAITSPVDRVGLVVFAGMGLAMSGVADLYRRHRRKVAAYDRDAALRESQARLATFAEATFEGIVESEASRILDCNEQFARMFGYAAAELRGMMIADLVAPDDRDRVMASIRQGRESVIEHSALRKDGTRIFVEAHGRPVSPGSAKRHSAVRDITARKQAERALQTTLQRFYAILSSMYSEVLLVADEGRVEFANQAFCDRFGLAEAPADLVGLASRDMIAKIKHAYLHPDEAVARIREILDRNQPVRGEELAMQDGRTCLRDFVPLNVGGMSYGRLWLHFDITERKQAEEALRESQERYRSLFTGMTEGFALHEIVTDEAGTPVDYRFLDINPAFERLTGLKREDVLGRRMLDILPTNDPSWLEMYGKVALTGEPAHLENFSTPLNRWYQAFAYQPAPRQFAVIFADITLRKEAQDALLRAHAELEQKVSDRTAELAETVEALEGEVAQRQQAETQLQRVNRVLRMLSASNAALVRIDDEARLMQEICRIAVEVGGYRMAWVGLAEDDPDQGVRPVAATGFEAGYLETARITWADTARGRGPTGAAIRLGEVQIGTDFFTEPRLAPWRAQAIKRGFRSSIALPLRQGAVVVGALTIYAAEPAAFPAAQVNLLRDLAEDLSFGIQAVRVRTALRESRDRSRALAAELTLAEQRERRRLADVLHDGLQQHLVAARLRAHMLKRSPDEAVQAGAHEVVALLEEAIAQSRSLTGELNPPALQKGNLLPPLEWLARWMLEKHKLTVRVQPADPPLPAVAVEVAVLLYQAVRELLLNAVKYAEVSAAEVTLTRAGEVLTLTVADAGLGFDPTTLRVLGGTEGGYGLLGIRERLELLGGRLKIESAPGQGSRFTLTVPLHPSS